MTTYMSICNRVSILRLLFEPAINYLAETLNHLKASLYWNTHGGGGLGVVLELGLLDTHGGG